MLEGLVAWVLNNYLGKYVHLNTDQLSVALLSGKVELENLPLRKDALRHLGLPVVIKAGFIGKVQLQIPVRQIRSAPWVIAFEQLYLVASPLPVHEWDHEAEELTRHELKLHALDTLEAKWRLKKGCVGFKFHLLCLKLFLMLKIQDVHLRYEDSISIPGQSIAFGITIESLTAQSCDSNWIPGFITGKSDESFKLLDLKNFGLYWMIVNDEELMSNFTLAKLAEAMSPNQTRRSTKNYIVPSVSAQAHLKRNRSTQPLRSNTPRIVSDLILEEVLLTLVDWQYNQIVTCVRGLDHIARLRSYRRQPAICKPRATWESCLQKARENVKYVQICMKLLITPTASLTAEEKKTKENVEWNRDYDDLKVLRQLAMSSVKLPDSNPNNGKSTGRSMLVNWFPTWMGWYSSTSCETVTPPSPEATELEGEILQVLADSAENNTILKGTLSLASLTFASKEAH
ncbi:hypothetical protein NQ317_002303 [Molorchus minor]|uniref:Chorein N-terminal domain-containing protein n=1 Tax=Molorchus minor TaxID=1323400 RepID=A0ABQ9J8N7_9CUCU|nr:hypothetical protein NQ317_002303 [Molorchus minor]